MYVPHLKKMIDIKKKIAEKIGYEKHPYDAFFRDSFEEELSVDDLDKVFGGLTPRIQKILKKLVDLAARFAKKANLENQSMISKELIGLIMIFWLSCNTTWNVSEWMYLLILSLRLWA